jgi:hypothetical protein
LGVLRDLGLVEAQRQGKRVVYSLRHPKVIDAVDLLRQIMNEEIARKQALRVPLPSPRRRDMAPRWARTARAQGVFDVAAPRSP